MSDDLDPGKTRYMARLLRIAMVTNQHIAGNLTKDEAITLLRGPLSPGDDTTIVDDSALLGLPLATIKKRISTEAT
jgi:hypothetical protein